MNDLHSLLELAGRWDGYKRVLLPGEAPHESESTAFITSIVGRKFMQMAYTWAFDGTAQEGVLLVGHKQADQAITVVWIDSWHMGDAFLICDGEVDAAGAVDVRGTYVVPSSPDWGWRMVITPGDKELRVLMYNITPDGMEILGVEAVYTRAAG
jgi:hypothetical protein